MIRSIRVLRSGWLVRILRWGLAGACFVAAVAPLAGDWPRWRGPQADGISSEELSLAWPAEGPRSLWTASVGIGFSSIVVADGRAFTLGNNANIDTVFCFDSRTGRPLWNFSYPCPLDATYYEGGPGSTPTIEGKHVFVLSKRGHVYCLDTASGSVVWQKNLMFEHQLAKPRWGFAGSPLIHGELLILNAGSGGTAFDKNNGHLVWTSEPSPSGYATPVLFPSEKGLAAALFSSKALVAVDPLDGKEIWRRPWITRWDINAADPIPTSRGLWVSSFDQGCTLLDVTGSQPVPRWASKEMASHFNSGVILNDTLIGIHGNTDQPERELRCLDLPTGKLLWSYPPAGLGSVTAARNLLIVLSDKGELMIGPARRERFEPVARAQVLGGKCWTVPVLAHGRLYCRNAQGKVICLDVGSGPSP